MTRATLYLILGANMAGGTIAAVCLGAPEATSTLLAIATIALWCASEGR